MSRLVRLRQRYLPEGIRAFAWFVSANMVIIYVNLALPPLQRARAARMALHESNVHLRRWLTVLIWLVALAAVVVVMSVFC